MHPLSGRKMEKGEKQYVAYQQKCLEFPPARSPPPRPAKAASPPKVSSSQKVSSPKASSPSNKSFCSSCSEMVEGLENEQQKAYVKKWGNPNCRKCRAKSPAKASSPKKVNEGQVVVQFPKLIAYAIEILYLQSQILYLELKQ